MEKYTLFLDESVNVDKNLLLMAGFAIKNNDTELLEKYILNVKKTFWEDEYIISHSTVLHCTELTTIYNNRNNPRKNRYINRDEYNIFKTMSPENIKNKYSEMYKRLCETIKKCNITIFGCIVDKNKYDYLFGDTCCKLIDDHYSIGLQTIIENFTHFLYTNNGVGDIVYESRNGDNDFHRRSPDVNMYNNFCAIKVANKGLQSINCNSISNRIRTLDLINKNEELAGLELTDFIVFNMLKSISIGDENQKSEFIKKIETHLYNGSFDLSNRDLRKYWGIRTVPEDLQYILSLEKKTDTLKRAFVNLKKEKDNLIEKSKKIQSEKEYLKKELEVAKKVLTC